MAHDILKRMEYLGENVQKAVEEACKNMTKRLEGTGGAICLDKNGDVGIYFTSRRMAWAYQKKDIICFGIEKQDDGINVMTEKI